jgi:carbonic anhydrase/acetyltransferase-like protein (isoleucine patch superfamily)
MGLIKSVRGFTPQIHESVYLAENSSIIGNVTIKRGSSVWYQAVLRGDVMPIVIGEETNIQDGTIIHGTFEKWGTTIGNKVTIGHQVVLHGTTIEDLCLIGMGSILMDGSYIAKNSIVGAGSLVTEGSKFPEGSLIIGRPAKVLRPLTKEELQFLPKSADNYKLYTTWYK